MTWREFAGAAKAKAGALRARLPSRKKVLKVTAGLFAVGFVIVGVEAIARARLDAPRDRVPTTFFTRQTPWQNDGTNRAPVAIGTLDGSALDERRPEVLAQFPDNLIQSVLAVEDQRFFSHHGLDIKRIAGALVADVRARGITQGGSTLTQQLAKNLFLSASRTPLRKIREAAIAVVLELRYSKQQILEAYLNEIYLGQDGARAIHGVSAASRFYFGKDVKRLTLAECAQLAAMISAPNRTAPSRHPDAARDRRDMVLQLMVQQQRITERLAARATASDITSGEHSQPALDSRYFRDYVAANMKKSLPARGASVYTTLDASLQRAAERAMQRGVDRGTLRGSEAALVALDPRTGDVLAMVGGRDYSSSQFNRAVAAHRQPGSAFKPIVALAALAKQKGGSPSFTLASIVDDEPLQVTSKNGDWTPTDYDGSYRGPVTVRQAMEQSLNIPFARIGLAIGPERVVAAARRVGIASPLHAVPSIALGSSEVTLLELSRAYGVLATSGSLATTHAISSVQRGSLVQRDSLAPAEQVVDSGVAYLVTSALEGVAARGTGRALNEDGRFGGIAGKTGTSNDWRDAWFIAYSSSLVVGVWVGFDDGRSLQNTGATAALPIAEAFLEQVTPAGGWPEFDVPSGIEQGYAGAGSDGDYDCGTREYFLAGTQPRGGSCTSGDEPVWRGMEDLGNALSRRAQRLIEGLISRRREWERLRGN